MIDKETLKKHNLKPVPFACIGEGETFLDETAILFHPDEIAFWERRICGRDVLFFDGCASNRNIFNYEGDTVYVPVWRTCREVAK